MQKHTFGRIYVSAICGNSVDYVGILTSIEARLTAAEKDLSSTEEKLSAADDKLAAIADWLSTEVDKLAAIEERLSATENELSAIEEKSIATANGLPQNAEARLLNLTTSLLLIESNFLFSLHHLGVTTGIPA